MFKEIGSKFAKGAKEEIAKPETVNKVVDVIIKIAVVALLIFANKGGQGKASTVIVNNYISTVKNVH